MYRIIINIVVISLFSIPVCNSSFGQSEAEITNLRLAVPHATESEYIDSAKIFNSEYDLFFGFLFTVYKKYISSQDASSCSFTPSCSEYALVAIRKQGTVQGLMNFWDRFQRCNGMNSEYYPIDFEKKLLVDPVRDWRFHAK